MVPHLLAPICCVSCSFLVDTGRGTSRTKGTRSRAPKPLSRENGDGASCSDFELLALCLRRIGSVSCWILCAVYVCEIIGLIHFSLVVAANEDGLARTNPLLWVWGSGKFRSRDCIVFCTVSGLAAEMVIAVMHIIWVLKRHYGQLSLLSLSTFCCAPPMYTVWDKCELIFISIYVHSRITHLQLIAGHYGHVGFCLLSTILKTLQCDMSKPKFYDIIVYDTVDV